MRFAIAFFKPNSLLALVFVTGLVFASHSSADELDKVFTSMAKVEGLRADFVEKKKLALMTIPLESKGSIYFSRTEGLVREVSGHGGSKAWVKAEKVLLKEGQKVREIPLQEGKAITKLIHSFRNVLLGKRKALAKDYALAFKRDGKSWSLTLTPKDKTLLQFMKQIEFRGEGEEISSMVMLEKNGDETKTVFSNIKAKKMKPGSLESRFKK